MVSAEEIAEYLCALREKTGYSVQKWSDLSGVPVTTINRLLGAKNASPQFCNVAALVKAGGGSLDELTGIEPKEVIRVEYTMPQHAQTLIDQLNARIARAEEREKYLRKGNSIKTVIICVLLFIFGALVAWDLSDPRYGFIYRVSHYNVSTLFDVVKG